jgi:curved DNA-binding protein CbpA
MRQGMAPVEITDDYYAVLEVSCTATQDIIRKNYLRLAKELHPDKNLNKPGANAAFQLVILILSKLLTRRRL